MCIRDSYYILGPIEEELDLYPFIVTYHSPFGRAVTGKKVGESFTLKNEKIIFKKIAVEKEKNYESIIGFFEVLDEKNKIINLQPEIRIYNEPEMATSEASIKTTLFKDRFITINIIKDQNFFNVRYQHKPFMIWIWISTLIIMLGGMFAIFRKNKEVNI